MSSWGILGKPTQEEIEKYKNMPYGKFKDYIIGLKKKHKDKTLNTYTVRIQEHRSDIYNGWVKVRAWDADEAIKAAKSMQKKDYEWETSPAVRDKYTYEYRISQVDS